MAINFNKLFLQNLLPNRHPSAHTATHDTCDGSSVSDYDNGYTESAHANSSFFLDNQNDKLTQALESLRRVITTHKVHQQRYGRRQVLEHQATSSTVEGVHSGPLRGSRSNHGHTVRIQPQEYQHLPTRNDGSWDNHRMSVLGHRGHHHRKSLQGYHPYSVDLAPTVLGLSGDQSFKENDRLSRKADKVVVEVRVVFLKIGEIDTLKETFRADAFIQARWSEPRLNEKSDEELARIDLSKCWNPLIYIENILSESKDQHWMSYLSKTAEAEVVESALLLLIHRLSVRSIQQRRQDDRFVYLQFDDDVETVSIPNCVSQTADGLADFGSPACRLIVDFGIAREGAAKMIHELEAPMFVNFGRDRVRSGRFPAGEFPRSADGFVERGREIEVGVGLHLRQAGDDEVGGCGETLADATEVLGPSLQKLCLLSE
ncbi:hypothetical protein SprV_0200754000 [Sparganum proliferum]